MRNESDIEFLAINMKIYFPIFIFKNKTCVISSNYKKIIICLIFSY